MFNQRLLKVVGFVNEDMNEANESVYERQMNDGMDSMETIHVSKVEESQDELFV